MKSCKPGQEADSFNLEMILKFDIFSGVRKCIVSLLIVTLCGTLTGGQELPDGLRYRDVRKIVSNDSRALFKSAERSFRKGKYQLADQAYLGIIKKGEKFYGTWGRACVARQKEEFSATGKFYESALSLNDSLAEFLNDYVRFLLINARDWNLISKVAGRLYACMKSDEALLILINAATKLDQRPAASESLRNLIRQYPDEANVRVFYASLLRDSGQNKEAVDIAQKAVKLTIEPFQLKLLVMILAQEGYFIDGAQACEKLSDIAPRSAQTFEAWGFLEYQQGHYQNAVTHYRKALNRDYRLATLLTLARLNAFYLNEPAKAIYYAKAIQQLDRDNCDALYILAEVKRRQGDLTAALKYSVRQMELQPNHPQPYYYHGKLLLQKKDYASAVTYLETAVRYNPDIKRYRLVLAKAYAGAGMMDKARETYTNYLNEPLKDLWQEENMLTETPPQPR